MEFLGDCKKYVAKHRYKFYLFVSGLFIFMLGLYLKNINFFTNQSDKINFYGFSLTFLVIIFAIIQSEKNHDWNRRHTASTSLLEIKKTLDPNILLIHSVFGYMNRSETDTIKVKEIHEKICKKEGSSYIQDDTTKLYKLCDEDESKKLYRAIWDVLNQYEFIATNVYHSVYDRQVVADLMKSNIIKISSVFSEYIDHVNNDMYKNRNGEIWINIKTLGSEFKKEFRGVGKSAKQRQKT